jgi:hypothetical protein
MASEEMWMRRWMWSVMGLAALVVATGCQDDLYAPCQFNQNDPQAEFCGADGVQFSCAIENSLQCETRVCARFEGGDAFCTKACVADDDCGAQGTCREFVFQSGKKYCVEVARTE